MALVPDYVMLLVSAGVIVFAGIRLTRICDDLADRTGLGEAMMGAVFLGAVTSLSGITASVTAAMGNAPVLALSNAYGGIAAQTLFIAFADIFYPRSNLEHAAASLENMLMGVALIILLSLLVFAAATPTLELWQIHPVSLLLPIGYVASLFLVREAKTHPMWKALQTEETREDIPRVAAGSATRQELLRDWGLLALSAAFVIGAGWTLTRSVQHICTAMGFNESLAGALVIAVITSLPELTTSIAAVRQGALTLAVGGILGGNTFDTLFAAVADYAYREGPIYAHVTGIETGLLALCLVMTGVIMLGLLNRQRQGPGGIGFESLGVILIYLIGMTVLFVFQ